VASYADLTSSQRAHWRALADQDIAAAQEIANHEGHPVHVGCGGEVWSERHGRRRCHRCDRGVELGDVVEPEK
jgi:hypothetical protein